MQGEQCCSTATFSMPTVKLQPNPPYLGSCHCEHFRRIKMKTSNSEGNVRSPNAILGTLVNCRNGAFVNGIAIEPFASLEGIWTFSEEGSDDLVVDTLAGNNELRGKVVAGVKAVTAGGTTLAISGSYDGLGDDDFQAISGELRLAIPLQ